MLVRCKGFILTHNLSAVYKSLELVFPVSFMRAWDQVWRNEEVCSGFANTCQYSSKFLHS